MLSMIPNPGNDALGVSSSVELNRSDGLVLSVPQQSGISADVKSFHLIESAIEFSKHDVWVGGQRFSCCHVFWGNGLAVSAPGSVDLHQKLLIVSKDQGFVVIANESLDGSIIVFRDRGRFQKLADLAGLNPRDKGFDAFLGEILGLGHELVLGLLQHNKHWGCVNIDTEVLREPFEVVRVGGPVNDGVDSVLCVFFGSSGEDVLSAGIGISEEDD